MRGRLVEKEYAGALAFFCLAVLCYNPYALVLSSLFRFRAFAYPYVSKSKNSPFAVRYRSQLVDTRGTNAGDQTPHRRLSLN